MVKEIISELGSTFSEYALMPGYTRRDCVVQNISLDTNLAGLHLKIPLLSAAMTSVTGYEMALALGKEGGLGVLPARLPIEKQAEIVRHIKNYEMGFVEEPSTIRENTAVENALRLIESHGHSKIPVIDKNNLFKGIFTLQHYWETNARPQDPVTSAMLRKDQVPFTREPGITVNQAKNLLEQNQENYLIILDDEDRLVKLAFRKDIEKIKIGAAISTHEGWEKRVEANAAAGVDLIVIDTSDAHSDFVKNVLERYKEMRTGVPICAGNIVTREAALFLMENGADIVKVGMSSGSICTTQREKAVGRAPMTALIEASKAREEFMKTQAYVPLIMDGGIASAADMIIALSIADAVMMGGYFNKFYEVAAEKYDDKGKETRLESEMRQVATWGEGSERARNLDRYGHATQRTFFAEGVEDKVPYRGRLKPNLKLDLIKIKAALSNAGCMNLPDFRERAVLEKLSMNSSVIVSNAHNINSAK